MKNHQEALKILNKCKVDIYLDYPKGRTKPPKPTITLKQAIELSKHPKVKYLAVSNIEEAKEVTTILKLIDSVEFIPKIETAKGVRNLDKIIEVGIKTIMLDKEDLYTDVKCNSKRYNMLVDKVRKSKVKVLELKGVIFS